MKIWTAALAGGLLALGAAAGTPQANAQAAPFLDTPTNHWAYEAVQDLAKKGIVIGYPDGTYGGKRPMTRYEFAVALDRALRTVADMVAAQQPGAPPPPPGTPPPSAVTQDDLNRLQALIDRFRPELDTIQTNLKTAQDNIDALRADVLDAKALANKAQATADNSYGVGTDRKFQISGYVQARYQAASAGQGALGRFPQGVAGGAGAYNGNYLSGSSPSTFDVRRARLKFSRGGDGEHEVRRADRHVGGSDFGSQRQPAGDGAGGVCGLHAGQRQRGQEPDGDGGVVRDAVRLHPAKFHGELGVPGASSGVQRERGGLVPDPGLRQGHSALLQHASAAPLPAGGVESDGGALERDRADQRRHGCVQGPGVPPGLPEQEQGGEHRGVLTTTVRSTRRR